MIAYKFLLGGAIGPFSRFAWPAPSGGRPGPWVQAGGGVQVCRTAVHACRAEHLPWWIQPELWEVELTEPVRQIRHKLTAPSGRLLRRVEAWDAEAGRAFAADCAHHARDLAAAALDEPRAARLTGAPGLDELAAATRELAPGLEDRTRIAVTMAGDAALSALDGGAAVCGYIAAHTARHLGGADAMAAERRRQAAWIVARCGL